jgi:hypothetical protein
VPDLPSSPNGFVSSQSDVTNPPQMSAANVGNPSVSASISADQQESNGQQLNRHQTFALEQVDVKRLRVLVPQVQEVSITHGADSCALAVLGIAPWQLHGIPVGRTRCDGTVEIATGLRTYQIAKDVADKTSKTVEVPVYIGELADTQIFDLHLQSVTSLELMTVLQQGYLWRYCADQLSWSTTEIFNWLVNRGGRVYGRQYIRNAIALTYLPAWLQTEILLAKVSQSFAIALGELGERNTEPFYKHLQSTTLKFSEKLKFLRRILAEAHLDLDSLSSQDLQARYDEFFPLLETPPAQSQSSEKPFTLRLVEAENEISLELLLNSTLSSLRQNLNTSINSIHWHKRFEQIRGSLEKKHTTLIHSVTLTRALWVALCLDCEGNINPLFQPLLAQRGIDSRPALLKYLEDSRDDQTLDIGLCELLDLTASYNPYLSRLLKSIGINKPRLPELPSVRKEYVSVYFDPEEIRGNFYNGKAELIPTLILYGLEASGHRFRISDLRRLIRSVSDKVLRAPSLLSHVRLEGIPTWLIEHLNLHRTSEGIFWYQQSVIDGGAASRIEPGIVESRLVFVVDKELIPPNQQGELLGVTFLESTGLCVTVRFPEQICTMAPESLHLHPEDLQAIRGYKVPQSVYSRQAA